MGTTRERILGAVITDIEARGRTDLTMSDIARIAGVDRKTVYRAFPNRAALLNAVAFERINDTHRVVKELVDECVTLQEALVLGVAESLHAFRRDAVVMHALEAGTDRGIERYIVSPDSPIIELMVGVWKGAFARARRTGELRDDLDDRELANWLLGIFLILLLREDLDRDRQAQIITSLVLPGLRPAHHRSVEVLATRTLG